MKCHTNFIYLEGLTKNESNYYFGALSVRSSRVTNQLFFSVWFSYCLSYPSRQFTNFRVGLVRLLSLRGDLIPTTLR